MSKKHVDEYFNVVANQYTDMLEALKDMEEECTKGLLDPDRLEQMKKLIEPLKQNYMRISYIMFLLNKPNRTKKEKRYIDQQNKFLNSIPEKDKLEGIKEENKKIVDSIHM